MNKETVHVLWRDEGKWRGDLAEATVTLDHPLHFPPNECWKVGVASVYMTNVLRNLPEARLHLRLDGKTKTYQLSAKKIDTAYDLYMHLNELMPEGTVFQLDGSQKLQFNSPGEYMIETEELATILGVPHNVWHGPGLGEDAVNLDNQVRYLYLESDIVEVSQVGSTRSQLLTSFSYDRARNNVFTFFQPATVQFRELALASFQQMTLRLRDRRDNIATFDSVKNFMLQVSLVFKKKPSFL